VSDASSDAFAIGAGAWTIEFKERARPTFIKTTEGADFPASGRLWIDPATGTVLASELIMDSATLSGAIVVSYQSEPLLGFRVPVAMDERHRTNRETVEGRATYGRFRQFQVKTDMVTKPPGE
jgi:hypothetical protein